VLTSFELFSCVAPPSPFTTPATLVLLEVCEDGGGEGKVFTEVGKRVIPDSPCEASIPTLGERETVGDVAVVMLGFVDKLGDWEGMGVGANESVGCDVGNVLGFTDKLGANESVGCDVGISLGFADMLGANEPVGCDVGIVLGFADKLGAKEAVGCDVGIVLGFADKLGDSESVKTGAKETVGNEVRPLLGFADDKVGLMVGYNETEGVEV